MTTLRGILVNDPRINAGSIDATLTTADEAGPYPGPALDLASSNMVWRTSGSMASDEAFALTVTRGGFPGVNERAGGFAYTDADSATYYWDPPGMVTGMEVINFVSSGAGTSSATKEYEPHLLRMADGRVMLFTRTDSPAIRSRIYDPSDGSWSAPVSITDATYVQDVTMGLCAVQMPDGIHLFHAYQYTYEGADYWQIATWVSTDEGATWTLAQLGAFPFGIAATSGANDIVLDMTAAYSDGQVSLVINTHSDDGTYNGIAHAASSDGLRFVYDVDGALLYAGSVLPADGGGFLINQYESEAIGTVPLPSAFAWFDDVYASIPTDYRWITSSELGTDVIYTDGDGFGWHEHALCKSEDGTTYALVISAVSTSAVHRIYRRSTDRELDWAPSAHNAWNSGGVEHLHRPSIAMTRGQMLVAAELVTEDGQVDDGTIVVLYLGGHTTQSMPPSVPTESDVLRQGWDELYLPWSVPGSTSWTATGAGTQTLEAHGLSLSCTSAQTRYFDSTTTYNDDTAELLVEVDVGGVSGASSSGTANQPRAGLDLIYTDTTAGVEYRLFVNFSDTGFEVYDFHSATQLASVVTDASGTTPVQVRVLLYKSRMAVYYRPAGASPSERDWLLAGANSGLTSSASTIANHRIRWGVISTIASGTTTIDFHRVAHCEVQQAFAATGVRALPGYGRPIAARPMGLPSGLVLEAIDGPAAVDDAWFVSPAHRYGFEALHTPSSQQQWRSASADYTTKYITWDLTGWAADSDLMGSTIGVAIFGTNVGAFALYGRTNAGVDTLLCTATSYPQADGTSITGYLEYQREGNVLTCPSGHSGDETGWIAHNELAGHWAIVSGSAKAGQAYRILGNTSGVWSGDSSEKQVRILLDADDDPSTLDVAGNINITGPACVGWAHDITADYRYLRLAVTGHTYDDDFRIGRVVIGPVRFFGKQYGREVLLEQHHNVQLTTRDDGSRTAQVLGPQRRTVTIAWRDGVDETGIWAGSPRLVATGGGGIVAAMGDTAQLMRGIFSEAGGPLEPVVYLAALPSDDDTLANVRRLAPDTFLYGRMTNGQLGRQQFLGAEGESGVFRINETRFEEEV